MPRSIADWAILGGVFLWDLALLRFCWWLAYRDRISWRVKPRKIKVPKDKLTRDWKPLV